MKSSLFRAATLPKAQTKPPSSPPPSSPPLSQGTLPEKIASHLLRSILSGSWHEGMSLPSETSLAHTFATNRVSLRQAMQIVKTAGLIEGGQGRSWKVTSLWDNLVISLLPDLIEARGLRPEIVQIVEDYLAIRTPILGWVAFQAASPRTPSPHPALSTMQDALASIQSLLQSQAPPSEIFLADFAWFEALIQASGSFFVQAMLRPLGQIYRRFAPFVGFLWEPAPAYPSALLSIQDAVLSQRPHDAQALLQSYIESERLRLLQRLHLAASLEFYPPQADVGKTDSLRSQAKQTEAASTKDESQA